MDQRLLRIWSFVESKLLRFRLCCIEDCIGSEISFVRFIQAIEVWILQDLRLMRIWRFTESRLSLAAVYPTLFLALTQTEMGLFYSMTFI